MKKISRDDFVKDILGLSVSTSLDSPTLSVKYHKIKNQDTYSIVEKTLHYYANKAINENILSKINVNSSAKGFVKGKSYLDFLSEHKDGYYFLRLDIKKFFPSISHVNIRNVLSQYLSYKVNKKDKVSTLDYAMNLITHSVEPKSTPFLPVGFSSSPILSNIIFRKIDVLIEKLCLDKNVKYTRYADDLLFSSSNNPEILDDKFINEISKLVSILSLKLNVRKTKRKKGLISLNGYVICNKSPDQPWFFSKKKRYFTGSLWVSNKKTKNISKLIYLMEKGHSSDYIANKVLKITPSKNNIIYGVNVDFYTKYCNDQVLNKARGYRSYLLSLIIYDSKNKCVEENYINKYSKLVRRLELVIDKYTF